MQKYIMLEAGKNSAYNKYVSTKRIMEEDFNQIIKRMEAYEIPLKYAEVMCHFYLNQFTDSSMLNKDVYDFMDFVRRSEVFSYYEKYKNAFSGVQIETFKTFEDFQKFVSQRKDKQEETLLTDKDRTLIWSNGKNLKLYHIKSHKASRQYGFQTHWCITMEDNQYWCNYTLQKGMKFYFLINTDLDPKTNDYAKLAFSCTPFNMPTTSYGASEAQLRLENITAWDVSDRSHNLKDQSLVEYFDSVGFDPNKIPSNIQTDEEVKKFLLSQKDEFVSHYGNNDSGYEETVNIYDLDADVLDSVLPGNINLYRTDDYDYVVGKSVEINSYVDEEEVKKIILEFIGIPEEESDAFFEFATEAYDLDPKYFSEYGSDDVQMMIEDFPNNMVGLFKDKRPNMIDFINDTLYQYVHNKENKSTYKKIIPYFTVASLDRYGYRAVAGIDAKRMDTLIINSDEKISVVEENYEEFLDAYIQRSEKNKVPLSLSGFYNYLEDKVNSTALPELSYFDYEALHFINQLDMRHWFEVSAETVADNITTNKIEESYADVVKAFQEWKLENLTENVGSASIVSGTTGLPVMGTAEMPIYPGPQPFSKPTIKKAKKVKRKKAKSKKSQGERYYDTYIRSQFKAPTGSLQIVGGNSGMKETIRECIKLGMVKEANILFEVLSIDYTNLLTDYIKNGREYDEKDFNEFLDKNKISLRVVNKVKSKLLSQWDEISKERSRIKRYEMIQNLGIKKL